MSLTISVVRSWDLDTVAALIDHLGRDEDAFDVSSLAVRNSYQNQLEGLAGDTVSASADRCYAISKDLGTLAEKSGKLRSVLRAFHAEAAIYRPKLVGAVDDARTKIFSVEDDGTVRPPHLTGEPGDPMLRAAHDRASTEAAGYQEEIRRLLRELERCDLEAANALNLMSMTESYVHYPYPFDSAETDPRTTAASATINLGAGAVDETAGFLDAAGAVTRGLPGLATVSGLGIGFGTSPEDEPFMETLAAEGIGALAAIASAWVGSTVTSAAIGGAAGSVVPVIGTAVGAVAGAVAGPAATEAVRDHTAQTKADGKVNFQW